MAVFTAAVLPIGAGSERRRQPVDRLRRMHRRAVQFLAQQAGSEQRLVAHRLGRKTHARSTGRQAIERIAVHEIAAHSRRLAVCRRSDDLFQQPLGVPADADVFGR